MHNRTAGARLLLVALLLWVIAGLGIYFGRRYLQNVLFGPFPLDRADLVSLADPDDRLEYFVTVDGDEVKLLFPRAYTGGRGPYSLYGLLRVGRKWLLLRVPAGQDGRRLTGTLERLSDFEKQHVLGAAQNARLRPGDCLPLRLEGTRYFRTVGWLTGVLPLAALVVLAGILTLRAATRLRAAGLVPAVRPAGTSPAAR